MSREMGAPLDAWLTDLTTIDRRVLLKIASEDHSPLLAGLWHAIAAEIVADGFREARILAAHEADHRAEVERISADAVWPARDDPPRTKSMMFDPETRVWHVED